MSIGFIKKPTETERLFRMLCDENYSLRQSLDKSQHDLLKTEQKLTKAKEQLFQLGADISEFETETNESIEIANSGITESYEYTSSVEQMVIDNGDAITEIYEIIGE